MQELLRNKRVIRMLGLAGRIHIFDKADEALRSMVKPGNVPEVLITGTQMRDENIRGFMRRYRDLPPWVSRHCKVYLLMPPLNTGGGVHDDFYHPLVHKKTHWPLCVYEMMVD